MASEHPRRRWRSFTFGAVFGLVTGALVLVGPITNAASQPGTINSASDLFVGKGIERPVHASHSSGRQVRGPYARAIQGIPGKRGSNALASGAFAPSADVPDRQARTSSLVTAITGFDESQTHLFPPDTQVGASATRLIETVNSNIELLRKNPPVQLDTRTLQSFLGLSSTAFAVDARVFYDANATNPRFIVTVDQISGNSDANGVSRIWMAISRSPDPSGLGAGSWCRYNIQAKILAGTTNSSFADQPMLGVGSNTIAISSNEYTWSNPGPEHFSYDYIRMFDKTVAENNAASCPTLTRWTFRASSTFGDSKAKSVAPEQAYVGATSGPGVSNPTYFVNAVAGTSNQYRVWRIANVPSSPTFRVTTITGNYTYSSPPNAPQPGTTRLVDTSDTRINQVAGYGDDLWAVHGTGCQFTAGIRSACLRMVHLTAMVNLSTGGISTAFVTQQVWGGGDRTYFFDPGVAVNGATSSLVIPFQRMNASGYLSTSWTSETNDVRSPSVLLTSGTCSDTHDYDADFGAIRAGDYVGAQTDPSDGSFWIAGERAAMFGGICQWGTVMGNVT